MTAKTVIGTSTDVTRRCACGGEVAPYNLRKRVYLCRPCKAAYNRRYDHTYKQTAASHASRRAYARSAKGRATAKRYGHSEKGRALSRRSDRRRIYIGERRVGRASTPEAAAAINAHIRSRRYAFEQRFKAGAQVESVAAGPVSAEAGDRAD